MHAPVALYRLRDRLALTRPELTALLTASLLCAAGLVARHLPAPPEQLGPDVIRYERRFVAVSAQASAAPADSSHTVATVEKRAPRAPKAAISGPVGLNSATAAQLETLPRVGPKMAERILEYRAQRGRFSRVEELRNVKGIGDKTFAELRPLVTLD